MAGALRKTMVYLGLAEDEAYNNAYDVDSDFPDDYEEPRRSGENESRTESSRERDLSSREIHSRREHPRESARELINETSDEPAEVELVEERRAAVTPIKRHQTRVVQAAPSRGDLYRISTIHPRTYNEAKTIGEAFRAGTPVIMNLGDMDDADAKRLVDFAAGLVFGLHGTIERVTSKVFLLSPSDVEVAPAEKVKVPERAFFNQS